MWLKVVFVNECRDLMTIFNHFGGHFGDLFWSKIGVKFEDVFGRRKSVPWEGKIINWKLGELGNRFKFIGFRVYSEHRTFRSEFFVWWVR